MIFHIFSSKTYTINSAKTGIGNHYTAKITSLNNIW